MLDFKLLGLPTLIYRFGKLKSSNKSTGNNYTFNIRQLMKITKMFTCKIAIIIAFNKNKRGKQ